MGEISKNGVFFDTKSNKVVDSQPEEGVQIVAPGGEMTDEVNADVDRWKLVESGQPAPVETVTTESLTGKKPATKSAKDE